MTTNYSYNNKKKQKNNQQKPALDQTNPSIIPEELLSTDKIEECSSIAQNLDLTETDTRELQDIMSMILSRITEMGSKVSTSMIENNPICQTASKEHIKVSLEETIRPMMHQSVDFIHSIKKDIKEKCEKSIRKLIEKEKGHDYTTVHYLKTVRDFQRYYDYITPYEIKGKEEMEFIDALNSKLYF